MACRSRCMPDGEPAALTLVRVDRETVVGRHFAQAPSRRFLPPPVGHRWSMPGTDLSSAHEVR